jgi:hypothetical protein
MIVIESGMLEKVGYAFIEIVIFKEHGKRIHEDWL